MAIRKLNFLPRDLREWSNYFGTLFREGTFTATLTGVSGSTVQPVYYTVSGNQVALVTDPDDQLIGVSDSTTCTITGLPPELSPHRDSSCLARVFNNGALEAGNIVILAHTLEIVVQRMGGVDFTASGIKGLPGQTLVYAIRGR